MVKFNSQKIKKKIETPYLKTKLVKICIGDFIKIGTTIVEGNKERIQFYEGTVIAIKNSSINTTLTVLKTFQGIYIEKIFLQHSPKIKSILILKSSKIRKSKLYYLRNLKGKASKLKQRLKNN